MKIVESFELDQKKWDELVDHYQGLCYSKSWYLNATAKNWCVLVDEQFTKGIALAYNKALGKNILYPPIFGRTSTFFGMEPEEYSLAFRVIQQHFPVGTLQVQEELAHHPLRSRTFQHVTQRKPLNQLAKRMLNKALKGGLELQATDYKLILPFVKQELGSKIKELDGANFQRLEDLLAKAQQLGFLISTGIYQEKQLAGGLFFIRDGKRIFYVQGAATEEAKKNGGMYLAMDEEIKQAIASGLSLDFGGSDLEGVRRFFIALGGEDVFYKAYDWDRSPFWFRTIRKINKFLK